MHMGMREVLNIHSQDEIPDRNRPQATGTSTGNETPRQLASSSASVLPMPGKV